MRQRSGRAHTVPTPVPPHIKGRHCRPTRSTPSRLLPFRSIPSRRTVRPDAARRAAWQGGSASLDATACRKHAYRGCGADYGGLRRSLEWRRRGVAVTRGRLSPSPAFVQVCVGAFQPCIATIRSRNLADADQARGAAIEDQFEQQCNALAKKGHQCIEVDTTLLQGFWWMAACAVACLAMSGVFTRLCGVADGLLDPKGG